METPEYRWRGAAKEARARRRHKERNRAGDKPRQAGVEKHFFVRGLCGI